VELQEVPRPVFNSCCLALSTECGHTRLSYHKDIPAEVDADGHIDVRNIRVLNLSAPTSCVSLHFGCSVATSIDEWDGDGSAGHPLAALGILSGHIYEVQNSEWIQHLQSIPRPEWSDEHRRKLRHFVCAFRINVVQVAATSLQFFEGEAPLQVAATSFSRPQPVPPRAA
jgi:hypothetical protein